MENLEEKVDNSGFFDWLWKRKLLRNFTLSAATAASVLVGDRNVNAQQSTTLNHDPILLIHGLDIDFRDNNIEYCDFNTDRVISFEDFVGFSKKFGSKKNDGRYDEGYDIDRNDEVGFSDFVILSKNFNSTVNPLESTWDELAIALVKDLNWKSGGTVGRWISTENTKIGDFYYLRLSSGNKLTFDQQGDEVKLAVEQINKATGKNVILAGFSMGGLSARAYLQNYSDPKASALVTICTPHVGSYLAHLTAGKSEILDWQSRFKDKPWTEKEAQLLLAYVDVAAKDKPVIKHLAPCADSLQILNNNIYRMPSNLQYVNVVSQVPDQEVLDHVLELINKYLLDYQKCKQVASPGLLAKGDGVVPLVSQSLVYAVLNTPTPQNLEWYEQAKGNISENSEMQVSHLDGNKQVSVLEKILLDVIENNKSENGRIVFESNDGIYIVDPNGDNLRRLDPLKRNYSHQVISSSPNGDIVAVNVEGIYLIHINESNKIKLTEYSASRIDWSPDGKKIAFLSDFEIESGEIYTIDIFSKRISRITFNEYKEYDLDWSPDGKRIVYSFVEDPGTYDRGLSIIDVDTNKAVTLLPSYGDDLQCRWSPLGDRIVFKSQYSSKNSVFAKLYTVDVNGKNLRRLTDLYNCRDPEWSLDGSKILFRDGNTLYMINSSGMGQKIIGRSILDFSWSPNGENIVYSQLGIGTESYLYVLDIKTNEAIGIETGSTRNLSPVWLQSN